jgi:hypothetical protein
MRRDACNHVGRNTTLNPEHGSARLIGYLHPFRGPSRFRLIHSGRAVLSPRSSDDRLPPRRNRSASRAASGSRES